MKVAAIIQARMTSTRLPGKVLLPLPYGSSTSVLENVVKRIKKARNIDEVIIATTTNASDNRIVRAARALKVKCFRGSRNNVLSRFYHAAKENSVDVIVRLTADNPCVDAGLVDRAVRYHVRRGNDYTSTGGYPVGLNVEVFSFKALEKAERNAKKDFEKEHVTPYFYGRGRARFRIGKLLRGAAPPPVRTTLDTEADYAFMCLLFDMLHRKNPLFSTKEILALYRKKPWIALVNGHVVQKKVPRGS